MATKEKRSCPNCGGHAKKVYACPECGGYVSAEQYRHGDTNCGNEDCEHEEEPLEPAKHCTDCGVIAALDEKKDDEKSV